MRLVATVAAAVLLASAAVALAAGNGSPASQGQALFKTDCASCHTIGGGDTVAPDLKGIVAREGARPITSFITNPTKAIASGNPKIAALVKKFHGLKMPDFGLNPTQVGGLVAYLEAQGGKPAAPKTTSPATTGNAAAGKQLFTGAVQFDHGGAACISCHTVAGIGSLGGGQIGPNLTDAATRYGGAKGIASVLASIPFPKMIPVYAGHPLTAAEQADVAAFLATTPGKPGGGDDTWTIVVLGLGVTAVLVAVAFVVWPRRRLVVRKRIAPTSTIRRA